MSCASKGNINEGFSHFLLCTSLEAFLWLAFYSIKNLLFLFFPQKKELFFKCVAKGSMKENAYHSSVVSKETKIFKKM